MRLGLDSSAGSYVCGGVWVRQGLWARLTQKVINGAQSVLEPGPSQGGREPPAGPPGYPRGPYGGGWHGRRGQRGREEGHGGPDGPSVWRCLCG